MHKYIVGVDIGKKRHVASLTGRDNKEVDTFGFKNTQAGFDKFTRRIKRHADINKEVTVGMEATGHYWLNLYQYLKRENVQVAILNPLQTKSFRNTNIRGAKTDKVDSRLIAKVIRFGELPVYSPDETTIKLKQLTRFRFNLVKQITAAKLKLITLLDQIFPEFASLFSQTISVTSLAVLKEYPTPEEVEKVETKTLYALIKKASRSKMGKETANGLKEKAANTVGVSIGLDAFSLQIKILVEQIEHLESQKKKLERLIEEVFTSCESTLTSIPGVSILTAATIHAEIGSIARFGQAEDAAKALAAFAGVDPKPKDSGKKEGQRKMSKRGSRYLRTALWQAANIAWQHDPMFRALYQKQISAGKHHNVALSHVARKLIHVAYSLLRDKKEYQPVLAN